MTRQLQYQRGGIDVGKPEGESPTPYIVRIMQDGSDCCLHTIEGKPMDYVLLNEGIFCIRLESQVSVPLLAKVEMDGVLSRSNYRLLPYSAHTIRDIRTTLDERSIPLHYSRNKRHFEGCGATEDVIKGTRDIDYYCGFFRIFFFNVSEVNGGRWNIDPSSPCAVVMLRYGYYPHFQKVFPDCIPPLKAELEKRKPYNSVHTALLSRPKAIGYHSPSSSRQSPRGSPCKQVGPVKSGYHYGASSRLSPYLDREKRLAASSQRPRSPIVCSEPFFTEEPIEENGKLGLHKAPRSQRTSFISTGSVRSPSYVIASVSPPRGSTSSISRRMTGATNYSPVREALDAAGDKYERMECNNDPNPQSPTRLRRSLSHLCNYERNLSAYSYSDRSISNLRLPRNARRSHSQHSHFIPSGDTKSEQNVCHVSGKELGDNNRYGSRNLRKGTVCSPECAPLDGGRPTTNSIYLSSNNRSNSKRTNSSDGYKFVIEVSPLSAVKRSKSGNAEKKPIAERRSYSEDQSVTNTANTNHNTSVDISDDPVLDFIDRQENLTVEKKPTAIPDNIDISQPSSIASQQCNVPPSSDTAGLSRTVTIIQPEQKNAKSELEKAKEETLQWKRRYRDLAAAHERHDVSGLVSLAGTIDGNTSMDIQRLSRSLGQLSLSNDPSPTKYITNSPEMPINSNSDSPSVRDRDLDLSWSNVRKNRLSGNVRNEEKMRQILGSFDGNKHKVDIDNFSYSEQEQVKSGDLLPSQEANLDAQADPNTSESSIIPPKGDINPTKAILPQCHDSFVTRIAPVEVSVLGMNQNVLDEGHRKSPVAVSIKLDREMDDNDKGLIQDNNRDNDKKREMQGDDTDKVKKSCEFISSLNSFVEISHPPLRRVDTTSTTSISKSMSSSVTPAMDTVSVRGGPTFIHSHDQQQQQFVQEKQLNLKNEISIPATSQAEFVRRRPRQPLHHSVNSSTPGINDNEVDRTNTANTVNINQRPSNPNNTPQLSTTPSYSDVSYTYDVRSANDGGLDDIVQSQQAGQQLIYNATSDSHATDANTHTYDQNLDCSYGPHRRVSSVASVLPLSYSDSSDVYDIDEDETRHMNDHDGRDMSVNRSVYDYEHDDQVLIQALAIAVEQRKMGIQPLSYDHRVKGALHDKKSSHLASLAQTSNLIDVSVLSAQCDGVGYTSFEGLDEWLPPPARLPEYSVAMSSYDKGRAIRNPLPVISPL